MFVLLVATWILGLMGAARYQSVAVSLQFFVPLALALYFAGLLIFRKTFAITKDAIHRRGLEVEANPCTRFLFKKGIAFKFWTCGFLCEALVFIIVPIVQGYAFASFLICDALLFILRISDLLHDAGPSILQLF